MHFYIHLLIVGVSPFQAATTVIITKTYYFKQNVCILKHKSIFFLSRFMAQIPEKIYRYLNICSVSLATSGNSYRKRLCSNYASVHEGFVRRNLPVASRVFDPEQESPFRCFSSSHSLTPITPSVAIWCRSERSL